ncbi:cupin domain-containing protein [Pinirhizobacter sp.]|uniref:cupin domain-containing protein n=1 Tax=Pinirhizobacter sp. TaxID=2950432 RepID=UPI002F4160F4
MKAISNFRAAPIAACNALQKLSSQVVHDPAVGIRIATVLEDATRSYYATEIAPGKSVTPHYHRQGDELYIIFSGKGVIRTWQPDSAADVAKVQVEHGDVFNIPPGTVHQLVNTGTQPLVLLFACPPQHLSEDRVVPSPSSSEEVS